jgi:hypothetical protein
MLIDTRDHPPEPEPRDNRHWLPAVLEWLYPWPAVIVWLWIGGIVLTGFVGMLLAVSALLVFFWRISKAYPDWGLSDYRQ